jgi:hypothetical protein
MSMNMPKRPTVETPMSASPMKTSAGCRGGVGRECGYIVASPNVYLANEDLKIVYVDASSVARMAAVIFA